MIKVNLKTQISGHESNVTVETEEAEDAAFLLDMLGYVKPQQRPQQEDDGEVVH